MLYYEIYKRNESNNWIMCLHGFGGNSSIWYKQKEEYMKRFNVIFVDLHGHGNSKLSISLLKKHTYKEIVKDIITIIDNLKIEKVGLVGVSLGTIIARLVSVLYPNRVKFMVLAGAVIKFNFRCKSIISLGHMIKNKVPYMWLYKLFAWMMMPKNNHKKSRLIFIREAKKLGKEEFIYWFDFLKNVDFIYKKIQGKVDFPVLYVSGNEDHMFIDAIKREINSCNKSILHIIEKCGHVCNIEKHLEFNQISIKFIEEQFSSVHKKEKPVTLP